MNDIEQQQEDAAELLIGYAIKYAYQYIDNPDDMNAAVVALLVTALEKTTGKYFSVEKIYRC